MVPSTDTEDIVVTIGSWNKIAVRKQHANFVMWDEVSRSSVCVCVSRHSVWLIWQSQGMLTYSAHAFALEVVSRLHSSALPRPLLRHPYTCRVYILIETAVSLFFTSFAASWSVTYTANLNPLTLMLLVFSLKTSAKVPPHSPDILTNIAFRVTIESRPASGEDSSLRDVILSICRGWKLSANQGKHQLQPASLKPR